MSGDQEAQEDAQRAKLHHAGAWKRRAPTAAWSEQRGPGLATEAWSHAREPWIRSRVGSVVLSLPVPCDNNAQLSCSTWGFKSTDSRLSLEKLLRVGSQWCSQRCRAC